MCVFVSIMCQDRRNFPSGLLFSSCITCENRDFFNWLNFLDLSEKLTKIWGGGTKLIISNLFVGVVMFPALFPSRRQKGNAGNEFSCTVCLQRFFMWLCQAT